MLPRRLNFRKNFLAVQVIPQQAPRSKAALYLSTLAISFPDSPGTFIAREDERINEESSLCI